MGHNRIRTCARLMLRLKTLQGSERIVTACGASVINPAVEARCGHWRDAPVGGALDPVPFLT
jgi:hypothetical protein